MGPVAMRHEMTIVIADQIEFDSATLDVLSSMGARVHDDTPNDEDELIRRIEGADIVVVNFVKMNARVMDACPKLRYVISAAAGYDSIDTEHAVKRGITVLNCPTQNVQAVAEHAMALMFAVSRRIVEASCDLQSGGWHGLALTGTELGGKRLGLIGYGRIGKLIETRVSGLAMTVLHVNSTSSSEEVDEVIRWAEVVCLCTALRAETQQLIDDRRLGLMSKSAILINVARGPVVDQTALYAVLRAGKIRGAGLDVFEDEPTGGVAAGDIVRLAKLPNVVATPHIAYNTQETVKRLGEELTLNLKSCLTGTPQNVVVTGDPLK